MKCLLISVFLLIPVFGFSYSWNDTEQRNDVAYGEYTVSNNVIPSKETYRIIQTGMPNQNGRLRAGEVPGDEDGSSNSGVSGTPGGEVAIIPMLFLTVVYGLYTRERMRKKRQDK